MAHLLLPVAALFGLLLAGFVAVDLAQRSTGGTLNSVAVVVVSRAPAPPWGASLAVGRARGDVGAHRDAGRTGG